jgi:hypothetical protein
MSSMEREIIHLSYAERDAAFQQLMKSAARTLPHHVGLRKKALPQVTQTHGAWAGVVQLERAKAKRIVPPRRPTGVRKPKSVR